MFWRMSGLSTTSPVDCILDKENYTLEELLDEDEVIQECKALNSRLINFLRERTQVEQLVRYIVEEPPADAEKGYIFKFPFIACEIFTCEVDVILKTLIEDEELMNILFSFLEPERPHSTLLSGYFSKVVICLMVRKSIPFMNFIQDRKDIIRHLVDLIGITSIMEVLVRLVGVDDHFYGNSVDAMQWLDDANVLEMIVDKFDSSDSPEVHANAAETLCAIMRCAPSALSTKISSPTFVARLFGHALDGSRPKSVLVHSLSICIALLDPKRIASTPSYSGRSQLQFGSSVTANPETIDGMLEKLGDLLQLLDVSNSEIVLPTTYGRLHPPLGKHRLKVVEFTSVLLTTGSEAAEKELVQLGALRLVLDLFFQYPFNNFLHHHVENMLLSCLESRKPVLIDHLFKDCDLTGKILKAEKNSKLSTDSDQPTSPDPERLTPRIGNIGHITRIANKLIQQGSSNTQILAYLQENSEWVDWQTNVLLQRNAVENIYQWACGRPSALQDRTRDSDDDDFRDRDFDVAALANNLSQAFRYGIYVNDDIEEAHGPLERDDEDVYFDDESAEVVISSLRLGDDHDSGSLFTNSNWFAFDDNRAANEQTSNSFTSSSPSTEDDEVVVGEDDLGDTAASSIDPEGNCYSQPMPESSDNGTHTGVDVIRFRTPVKGEKPHEWVEWRESSDLATSSSSNIKPTVSLNGEPEILCTNGPNPVGEAHLVSSSAVVDNMTMTVISDTSDAKDSSSGSPSTLIFEDVELVGREDTTEAMELDAEEGVFCGVQARSHCCCPLIESSPF